MARNKSATKTNAKKTASTPSRFSLADIDKAYKHSVRTKYQVSDLTDEDINFLNIVNLVLRKGAEKHGALSWQRDPVRSDSTVSNNFSAILRHFTMIQEGRLIDDDGVPHVFHLACRVAMLYTTYLRNYDRDDYIALAGAINYKERHASNINYHITPEMILGILAYHDFELEFSHVAVDTKLDVDLHYYQLLMYISLNMHDKLSLHGWGEPSLLSSYKNSIAETLFFNTVYFIFNHLETKRDFYVKHLNLLDKAEMDLIATHLGIDLAKELKRW